MMPPQTLGLTSIPQIEPIKNKRQPSIAFQISYMQNVGNALLSYTSGTGNLADARTAAVSAIGYLRLKKKHFLPSERKVYAQAFDLSNVLSSSSKIKTNLDTLICQLEDFNRHGALSLAKSCGKSLNEIAQAYANLPTPSSPGKLFKQYIISRYD